jgi:tRNA U34 2-thiouridine synthase MnmA/TrmU
MGEYDGIVLYSGGLDSILACRTLAEQGLRLLAVKYVTVFFPLRNDPQDYVRRQKGDFGVEVAVEDVTAEYLPVVKAPRFGYGRWMNPCLDCKLFMYRRASELMARTGAAFLATGEVLGQRPMSQHRGELVRLAREAGLEGRLLRPLSALRLAPTRAEESGLVDRNRLLGLSGRGRVEQMRLAREKGISGYPTPAGGCLLTDETYARRLKDMFTYGDDDRLLPLLGTGRHFRLSPTARLTVGRNREENLVIERHAARADALLVPVSHMGPSAVIHGSATPELLLLAAGIVARYGDAPAPARTIVRAQTRTGTSELNADALDGEALERLRI